jgi:hypothetical protein
MRTLHSVFLMIVAIHEWSHSGVPDIHVCRNSLHLTSDKDIYTLSTRFNIDPLKSNFPLCVPPFLGPNQRFLGSVIQLPT